MASRDILEAAGNGAQPPCKTSGLFFIDADVVVEEPPFRVHEIKGRIKTIVHKVLNGPAKFRERNFYSDGDTSTGISASGTLQEEFYYNVDKYSRIWKHREWYSNGILARICAYNYDSRYHGNFLTFYDNGLIKTNQVFDTGRRLYDMDLRYHDDQVYVAYALCKEMKNLKGMFNGPPDADVIVDNND